ncbi:putative ATP-dependent DNA ligase [Natronoarchaeum philippinense]|uniref:Putative ATP-dependent DNA ligase n=1 Tax=Natronoarchaeum philippinense TaxID=558529 RepID=A0A285P2Y0_NATPI|nr:RNA ligase [Natronoarchaeum philippinense]SNZ16090.1 putative ATP-dependent DNA ligase [Natronoarchaeum philippinense]
MEYHRQLGLSPETFETVLDHVERASYEGTEYRHVPDYRRGVERGTVLFDGAVVRGFPKVPRTLVLGAGVPQQFDGPVAVEEKLNGYNTRIARIDGDVLAFSRSGLVCPYTTWFVERRLDLDPLFDDHPDTAVCGEMIGSENPYTPHDYSGVDSLAFRAFDWRDRQSGEPLDVRGRRERYGEYGVPQVRLFGVYDPDDAADELREIIDQLDADDREGIVMKSLDGVTQLKYTTSAANRGDLAYAFSLPFDYGQAFMFRRLIREAFQSIEWNESPEQAHKRAHAVGEAIVLSMTETIERVADGEAVGERHTVRGDPAAIDDLLDHLDAQGLTIDVQADDRVERERDGAERVVTFCKRVQSTNDTIRGYLDGQIVRE